MWIALLIRQRGNRRPSVCRRSATNVAVGINDREDPAIGASATETTTSPVNGARAFDYSLHDGPPGDDHQRLSRPKRWMPPGKNQGRVHGLPEWVASLKRPVSAKR